MSTDHLNDRPPVTTYDPGAQTDIAEDLTAIVADLQARLDKHHAHVTRCHICEQPAPLGWGHLQ